MTAFNGYPISFLFAVLLHGSVLASLFYFQRANTEVLDVIRPPSVKANLVGENPQVKQALVQQQQQQRRVEEQRAAQRREEEQRQAEARQQEQQRQEAERRAETERNALRERQNQERQQAEQRQAEEQKQREDQQRQQREEEQRRQAELAQQERQRQEQALQAQRDAEESQLAAAEAEGVMSYTSVIHDLVQRQWSRPPSARNGMVVVLRISMMPTGDITDVQVVQSSGDFAFDRAAETAVRRVNRFTELQGMPYALFERNFRSFLLTFRPEDLLN